MNPLPLFLIIVTLPLLLGGCGEKTVSEVKPEEPVAETKPKLEGVNWEEELEPREGLAYVKGSDAPYTGKMYGLYENGQKKLQGNYKNGKRDGLWTHWNENGQKKSEGNYKDGNQDGPITLWHKNGQTAMEANWKDGKKHGLVVGWDKNGQKRREENYKDGKLISRKYWNSKGEEVDSYKEANKE